MIRQIAGRLKTASKTATRRQYDALDLLRADHMKVEAMAVQLRLMRDPEHRKKLFRQIRSDLEKHMRLEEDFFYPACEKISRLSRQIDHAHTDHQLIKDVLMDLDEIDPKTPRFNVLLTKAIVSLERHIVEEENDIFAGVRKYMSPKDFKRMSDQMIEAHGAPSGRAERRAA